MLRARPVEVRPRLPAEMQDVLEALVRDERRPRAAALEQRVRRDRRAVREAIDPSAPAARAAATTDSSCRAAVGTFATRTCPSDRKTASVNVPPTSIPSARMQAFEHERRGRVLARAPSRLPGAQPPDGSRRAARAPRSARRRGRALPCGQRARRAADVLPHRALRTPDLRGRGRAGRARRCPRVRARGSA